MAEPKDDAPHEANPIADVFNSVANWGLDALGQGPSRRQPQSDSPFARDAGNPIAAWSLSLPGHDLVEAAPAHSAPPSVAVEPSPPSLIDLYGAHEKSYDGGSGGHDFVDPSAFQLAVRGAPPLEPLRHNTGSISGASPAQKAAPAVSPSSAAPMSSSAGHLGSDAISSGAASLYAASSGPIREDRAAADLWHRLYRH